jgi:hypothetical protein
VPETTWVVRFCQYCAHATELSLIVMFGFFRVKASAHCL